MSKNILIFSTAYFPLESGAEIAIKEITQRLPDWHFDLITARIQSKSTKFEKIGNINVYRVGFGLPFDKFLLPLFGSLKARKLEKKGSYGLIWSVMASQAGVAAALFKIFYPAKKLLLTLQEGDPEEYLKRYVFNIDFLYKFLIRPWHLLPFKRADYLTVISDDLKKRAQKSGIKCPVEIVPNGVNLALFFKNYPENELAGLKNKLGKKKDDKFIIHTGRLVFKNALDDVIKALSYLSENIKFVLSGDGSDLVKLQSLIKKLKLENRVIFLGFLPHQEMLKYLKISDIFIRPSLSEGLGSSFLEAMAAGLPIIGTPVGGIPDFLIDRETGLFCQVKNPKDIALKVNLILTDNSLRQKLIISGQKLIAEKYNWNIIAQKMERIYLKLL